MPHEYEIVKHQKFRNLNVFVVKMFSRAPHLHRDLEIGLILQGNLHLERFGKNETLSEGELFLINPMEVHAFSAADGATILAIQISYKIMNSFLFNPIIPRFTHTGSLSVLSQNNPEACITLHDQCLTLANCYLSKDEDPFFCFNEACSLLSLLIQYLPYSEMKEEDYLPLKQKADRMISILDYIDDNYQRKLLLEEIAENQGLTLTYMSHLFQETMGITFQDYLKRKRFEYACHLLTTTSRQLLDISLSSGFSDVRYMIDIFKKQTGLLPKQYRQMHQIKSNDVNALFASGETIFDADMALQLISQYSKS